MKIRILYAMMADDDSVLSNTFEHVNVIVQDDFWSKGYCEEQVFCQNIVNQSAPSLRVSGKLYKPVVQHWFRLYFE